VNGQIIRPTHSSACGGFASKRVFQAHVGILFFQAFVQEAVRSACITFYVNTLTGLEPGKNEAKRTRLVGEAVAGFVKRHCRWHRVGDVRYANRTFDLTQQQRYALSRRHEKSLQLHSLLDTGAGNGR